MGFFVYDLIFLGIFLVSFTTFLYMKRHNLKRDGLLFMYRTKWGIRLIEKIGKKYKKTLNVLSYVSIVMGYILTIGILYLIYTIVKIYLFSPFIVRAIKVPPIIPLVPYLPQVFKLSFLPPFYFTYWIAILAILAIPHEMFHGIFAAHSKVKIKTTGFAFFPYFFPIFPAAFVEQDEKSMMKAKKFDQMAILSAGTFANVLTGILFFFILWGFFALSFAPSGIIFDTYATSQIALTGITSINGVGFNGNYSQLVSLANETGFSEINYGNNSTFLATKSMLAGQDGGGGDIVVYDSAPAIKNMLESTIVSINGVKVDTVDVLANELSKYSPGDTVSITTQTENGSITRDVTLEARPDDSNASWLGIGFYNGGSSGIIGKITDKLSFKTPHTYYAPKFDGFAIFIYNLLWWIVLMSFTIAFVNMLPMGIFDGGRFFYLTILGLTKNERLAERAFKFSTKFFLFLILLLMVAWVVALWF